MLAWNELQKAAKEKQPRPFYRAVNKHGLMYAGTYVTVLICIHFHNMGQYHVECRGSVAIGLI